MPTASLAHKRLQMLHVSLTCSTIQPAPAHGKLSDEKRYRAHSHDLFDLAGLVIELLNQGPGRSGGQVVAWLLRHPLITHERGIPRDRHKN